MAFSDELTPCSVMFDVFKRSCGIKHNELAEMVLSSRPLSDGRSPQSRTSDRSWVSRFIVHAPAGSLQERYFADYARATARIMSRLRTHGSKVTDAQQLLDVICGDAGRAMDAALAACHQDAYLYRNVLDRIVLGSGTTIDERAEAALVLFVSVGCSGNVNRAVAYTSDYIRSMHVSLMSTPAMAKVNTPDSSSSDAWTPHLGLIRVRDGYVCGNPHWIEPTEEGVIIGALALGVDDITDVGPDVSAEHARVWYTEQHGWLVRDLGSSNGTSLVDGANRAQCEVSGDATVSLHAGDELRVGADTVFAVVEGIPESWS
uniref:FHA domain-containing protein n=1 Tax=Collinsella bouchesdurhonensis TaxID=1907654 RepID=UPI00359C650D